MTVSVYSCIFYTVYADTSSLFFTFLMYLHINPDVSFLLKQTTEEMLHFTYLFLQFFIYLFTFSFAYLFIHLIMLNEFNLFICFYLIVKGRQKFEKILLQ